MKYERCIYPINLHPVIKELVESRLGICRLRGLLIELDVRSTISAISKTEVQYQDSRFSIAGQTRSGLR